MIKSLVEKNRSLICLSEGDRVDQIDPNGVKIGSGRVSNIYGATKIVIFDWTDREADGHRRKSSGAKSVTRTLVIIGPTIAFVSTSQREGILVRNRSRK